MDHVLVSMYTGTLPIDSSGSTTVHLYIYIHVYSSRIHTYVYMYMYYIYAYMYFINRFNMEMGEKLCPIGSFTAQMCHLLGGLVPFIVTVYKYPLASRFTVIITDRKKSPNPQKTPHAINSIASFILRRPQTVKCRHTCVIEQPITIHTVTACR